MRFEGEDLVVGVRLYRRQRHRCGKCGRRCQRYDQGEGRRKWRGLDLGTTCTFIEAEAPRVSCPEHGVVVAQVPWADHSARSTRAFDDQVAWLATHCAKTAVVELMRISWRTVGRIIARVVERVSQGKDLLAGLHRIGIDEISYRRGQRYLIVIVDHDTGRLVWVRAGRDRKTLARFFDELGEDRAKALTHISADGADWIAEVVAERASQATLCLDPFHVVRWATDALDEIRREVWNQARQRGDKGIAYELKGARWALWKGAEHLTDSQVQQLSWIEELNEPLYRGYLLKEQLRLVFQLPPEQAGDLLYDWLEWAIDSGLEAFGKLADTILKHLDPLLAVLDHRVTNARTEALNTRIRLIARRAFGFRSPDSLIALAKLSFSGFCPGLPRHAAA
jgi:transposase